MSTPVYGNFGIRRLQDQFLRFFRGGLPTWLRIKNFVDNPAFADHGFQFVPSVTGATVTTGTVDILIDPPPSVVLISMQTIAMGQMAGSSLKAGARNITLSHTWVLAQMAQPWFKNMCNTYSLNNQDPTLVFHGPQVLGFVTDNLLLETVDYTHEDVYGQQMTWFIRCNASEQSLS